MQQMPLQFQLCPPIPEAALSHWGMSSDKESSSEAGAVDECAEAARTSLLLRH